MLAAAAANGFGAACCCLGARFAPPLRLLPLPVSPPPRRPDMAGGPLLRRLCGESEAGRVGACGTFEEGICLGIRLGVCQEGSVGWFCGVGRRAGDESELSLDELREDVSRRIAFDLRWASRWECHWMKENRAGQAELECVECVSWKP